MGEMGRVREIIEGRLVIRPERAVHAPSVVDAHEAVGPFGEELSKRQGVIQQYWSKRKTAGVCAHGREFGAVAYIYRK